MWVFLYKLPNPNEMLYEDVVKEEVFEWLVLSAVWVMVFPLSQLHIVEESILVLGTYIASTAIYLSTVCL